MGASDDSQETEPLRDSTREDAGDGLQVLDMEKHVLSEGEPRELFSRKSGQHPEKWTLLIAAVGALMLLASLVVRGRRSYDQTLSQVNIVYEFVGEGNCKPNRPQYVGEAPYNECREKCDFLPACIGFDWDARWTVCRLRFYTNAAISWPQPGFRAVAGVEGGRLMRQMPPSGFYGIEGSHTAGCFQKAVSVPFHRFLSQPRIDGGVAHVGPLPNVLEYYREAGLVGPLGRCQLHMKVEKHGLLEYTGTEGEMILPSLDASPLLRALHKDLLDGITLVLGVNSDTHGHGLGVAVEASPQINETKEHGESYVFNGDHLHRNRNVITFHPDSAEGNLRIEGPGGFAEADMGFEPAGWSRADSRLNTLEITTRVDGENKLVFIPSQGGHRWERMWRHKLFDGRDTPTLYAFTNSGGGQALQPLIIGRVSLKAVLPGA